MCTQHASGCLKTHIHLLKNAKESHSTTKWNFLTWVLTSESAASRTVGKMLFLCRSLPLSCPSFMGCRLLRSSYVNLYVERKKNEPFDGLERNAVQRKKSVADKTRLFTLCF